MPRHPTHRSLRAWPTRIIRHAKLIPDSCIKYGLNPLARRTSRFASMPSAVFDKVEMTSSLTGLEILPATETLAGEAELGCMGSTCGQRRLIVELSRATRIRTLLKLTRSCRDN